MQLFGLCKGDNFDIHIWTWFGYFICERKEIRFYLFGKEFVSCLAVQNIHAFNENSDSIKSCIHLVFC